MEDYHAAPLYLPLSSHICPTGTCIAAETKPLVLGDANPISHTHTHTLLTEDYLFRRGARGDVSECVCLNTLLQESMSVYGALRVCVSAKGICTEV